ncbi:hypothetical protein TgHK011_003732 [Trichoderma gracile]|nr:hypothetical protein TgHK011_003732 [Trichoderma gracile]
MACRASTPSTPPPVCTARNAQAEAHIVRSTCRAHFLSLSSMQYGAPQNPSASFTPSVPKRSGQAHPIWLIETLPIQDMGPADMLTITAEDTKSLGPTQSSGDHRCSRSVFACLPDPCFGRCIASSIRILSQVLSSVKRYIYIWHHVSAL